MKKLQLLALILQVVPLLAQQKQPVSSLQEDCGVTFVFNTASSGAQAAGTFQAGSTGTTPIIDNRQVGCIDWIVTYSPNTAVASVSLAFQVATDVLGVPTTWSNYPGTLNTGINPNTAITAGGAVTDATGKKYPFLRMNMTVLTGAGATISGRLYGWKRRPTYVSIASGGGCVGTSVTPCVVDGPTAVGDPVSKPPVQMGGQDINTLAVTNIQTDSGGGILLGASGSNPQGDATATNAFNMVGVGSGAGGNSTMQIIPFLFDGVTTWYRSRGGTGTDNLGTTTTTEGVTKVMEMMADPTGAAGSVVQMGSVRGLSGTGNAGTNALQTGQIVYNGTNFDLTFACTNRANVTLTTSGLTRIITGTAAKKIRLCSLSIAFASPVDVQVVEGTQMTTACDTGAANMTGLYRQVVGFDPNLSNLFALTQGTAADDVCISMGASVNGGGVAIYAVF